jgi:hypothetical protein
MLGNLKKALCFTQLLGIIALAYKRVVADLVPSVVFLLRFLDDWRGYHENEFRRDVPETG